MSNEVYITLLLLLPILVTIFLHWQKSNTNYMFCGYVADAMVSTGLSSLGYQYINIGTSSRIHIQIFAHY